MSARPHDDGSNVLVRFDHQLAESTAAHLLALDVTDREGVWIPKSQISHLDLDTKEVWIPLWLAEKKGLEYD